MNLQTTLNCYSEKEVGKLDHPETGFVTQLRDKVTMYIDQDTGEIQPPDAKTKKVKPLKAGGPGSGRRPSHSKGLNKWKSPEREREMARKDPKQRKLKFKAGLENVEMEGLNYNNEGTEPPKTGAYSAKRNPKSKFFKDLDKSDPSVEAYAHIEAAPIFHPPSLKNPDRIPTDDPGEKNDRFLDVSKRNSKDTKQQRMKMLKRSAPGGLPALIPANTTLIAPHTAVYLPGMFGKAVKTKPVLPGRTRLISRSF